MTKKALLVIDVQNDFMPEGALPVKNGDEIIPIIEKIISYPYDVIVASKDYHPLDHGSFAVTHHKNVGEKIILNGLEQILWPVHCVEGTFGAELAFSSNSQKIENIFLKGQDKDTDSYSAFFDNGHKKSTGLGDFLKSLKIDEIYVVGLATDYCVKFTVLDALSLRFRVYVVVDGCRGVNIHPDDSNKALKEMERSGALLTYSKNLISSP